MRIRWATVPVTVGATLALTAAAAFGATIMVDSDGHASPASCSSQAPAATTIQQGVNQASPGDTVKVCGEPAAYAGATVSTPGVKLVGVHAPVVQAPGAAALTLDADKTAVRGFEIRGSQTGVSTSSQFSGYHIVHNDIHGNAIGIYLNSDGTFVSTVSGNDIHDNNAAGAASGNGIYSDQQLSKANITLNQFVNNDNAGIFIAPQSGSDSGINIVKNSFSEELNSDVVFFTTVTNSKIARNSMSNATADPVNGSSSIFIAGDSHADQVTNNTITNPNFNGLAIRETAHDIKVSGNQITGAGNNGIDVNSTAPGAVNATSNTINNSGNIGINFAAGTSGSHLTSNHATGSHGLFNCQDQGSNTWVGNTTAPSSPVGICT
jgi:hypothetical protein